MKREHEAYGAQFAQLIDAAKKRLQQTLAQRTKDGDLDGALEIRNQIKEFDSGAKQ